MTNKALTFLSLLCLTIPCKAQQVNKALDLFLNNKTNEAETALLKIANDSTNKEHGKAGVALSVLYKLNESDEEKVKYFVKGIQGLENPDPYIYTFWGDCRFVNYPTYAKKVQDFYAGRKDIHPDIRYTLHHLRTNQLERADKLDSILALNKSFGFIDKWEILGSFDYVDGYGFRKDEGVVDHPESTFEFVGSDGGKLRWFPMIDRVDVSRFYMNDFVDMGSNGKSYLQSFIQAPADQEILLNIVSGSDVRCWVNDALVYENRKNIDCIGSLPFRFPVKLKAGNNRLLIQLGKKTNYGNNITVYCTDKNYDAITGLVYQISDKKYTKDLSKPATIADPDIESFNATAFGLYAKDHPDDLLEQILRTEEFNSNGDKAKTLLAIKNLRQKYPNSYYVSNMYYNNKSNVSYSSKDEYLNQNCEDCFATLMKKYNDAKDDDTKTKAIEALAKLESKYPNNYTIQLNKIEKLIDDNDYAGAEKMIDENLKKYDNKMDLYYYKSSLLTAQGKKDDNAAFLKSILPTMTNTSFSRNLADYYLEKNDTTNWLKVSQPDVKYSISDDDYYTLTNIYKSSKKYDSAEMVMKNLMLKKPYSSNVFERYADLLIDRGNKAEALKYFKKSLEYYPQDYGIIKKIRDNTGEKMEIDILAPEKLKELYTSKKINKMMIPDFLGSRSWVLLYRKEAAVVYEGAHIKSRGYYFYKILTEAGIKDFKELSSGDDGSELLIFKENGEISLPEGNSTWVLPDLKVGDIIGIKGDTYARSGSIKSTLYQNTISVNNNLPLMDEEHQVLFSKSLKDAPLLFGNTAEFKLEKKEWNKLFDLYTVTAHNPAFIEPELHCMNNYENHTYFALSNFSSWDEIAKWYWDIASPMLVSHDSITNIVNSVLKDSKGASQYQKARMLYKWVEKNINYSSQSFRQDNYVPQKPNKVVEDKLGDCKDMAALYILMCKEAGIKGHFVLVNMQNRAPIYNRFPNNSFNHCIAKVYPDGKPLYVELTAKNLPFGQNTNYTDFAYGLEIDSEKQCTVAPVYNEGKGDFMNMSSKIKIENGSPLIEENIAATGVTSSYLKEAFEKADSTQINTALQKLISSMLPNSKMYHCSSNAKDLDNDSLIMNYSLGNSDLYIDVADLQIYKVPTYLNKMVEESVFANKGRKTDLSFTSLAGYLTAANNQVSIEIPKGKTLFKNPVDFRLSNQYFDFQINYQIADNKLNIDKKFIIKQNKIKTTEFAEFKTEMEKAYKADVVTIVMQ